MAPRFVSIPLGPNDDGRRVDRVARKAFPDLALSKVYSAIRSGDIRLNGRKTTGDARVAAGDSLDAREGLLTAPATSRGPGGTSPGAHRPRRTNRDRPSDHPAPGAQSRDDVPGATLAGRIVFQSAHLLVVAKLRGELVHGPDSLEPLVTRHLERSLADGVSFRPGPVHRLDRNTTGLVVYAASLRGAQEMSRALKAREVAKLYVAVLRGTVTEEQHWDNRLERDHDTRRSIATSGGGSGSRGALTIVRPVASADGRSLVTARIVTGRTHQIRAHAQANGTPLLGDRKYGGPPLSGGYILHAGALGITKPPPEIGFTHLWTPLPQAAADRVRRMFGDRALDSLQRALSLPHD